LKKLVDLLTSGSFRYQRCNGLLDIKLRENLGEIRPVWVTDDGIF
jgi:hypothetical protein